MVIISKFGFKKSEVFSILKRIYILFIFRAMFGNFMKITVIAKYFLLWHSYYRVEHKGRRTHVHFHNVVVDSKGNKGKGLLMNKDTC